jgi:hypothetical protein
MVRGTAATTTATNVMTGSEIETEIVITEDENEKEIARETVITGNYLLRLAAAVTTTTVAAAAGMINRHRHRLERDITPILSAIKMHIRGRALARGLGLENEEVERKITRNSAEAVK